MNEVVTLEHLEHCYRAGAPVLRGIDLEVNRGEIVGMIGVSGAGKSTLLRCLNGLVTPTSGVCRVFGESVRGLGARDKRRLRRRIGMIFQEFNLLDRLSVMKNVLVGRLGYVSSLSSTFHYFKAPDRELARKCIELVGLSGFERRRVRDLSGGQKQRVAIARALAQQAELLLADEATANLDLITRQEIMELIVDVTRKTGMTVILSMHDLELARRYCTRIIGIKEGRMTFDADPSALTDSAVDDVLKTAKSAAGDLAE